MTIFFNLKLYKESQSIFKKVLKNL